MKPRQLLLIVLLLTSAAAAAWLTRYLREPRAQGRSLSQWMEEYELALNATGGSVPLDYRRADRAVNAIREMGPAGVRELMRRASQGESMLKLTLLSLAQKQSFVKIQHQPARYRRQWAHAILCDLGSSASNALPELAVWVNGEESRSDSIRLMASIGPASLPMLTGLLVHSNNSVRYLAAQALGWMGRDAAPAVPMLLAGLHQTNAFPRSAAIRSLGAIGIPRSEIEEHLVALLQRTNDALDAACSLAKLGPNGLAPLMLALTNSEPRVLFAGLAGLRLWHEVNKRPTPVEARELRQEAQRMDALFNLKALGAGFTRWSGSLDLQVAGVLVPYLTNENAQIRALSAATMDRFPRGAQFSVPALKLALKDEDSTVREAARRSLERLPDPPPPAVNPGTPRRLGRAFPE